jgi:hypothetical protein
MHHYAQTIPGNCTRCEALFVEFLGMHMTCYEAIACRGMQLLKQPFIFLIAIPKVKILLLWCVLQSNFLNLLFPSFATSAQVYPLIVLPSLTPFSHFIERTCLSFHCL